MIRMEMERELEEFQSGYIQHVSLKDFMNHASLEVDLHRRVNFIVGANGSGKSAIFTAIQLGLGGRAQDTWRDRSIKPFVKRGRTSARICITLGNDGEGAYQPDVCGKCIKIVRTITSSGSSSYEVIAENGAKIGDKRRDVMNVTSHFNIQLSNIGCMMSQNAAAQFLRTSGAEKRYEMVVRGLQLDEMEESLKRTKEFVQDLKQQHIEMKRRRRELEKEKKETEELVQRSEWLKKAGDSIKECLIQKAIFQDQEFQMQIVGLEADVEEIRTRIEEQKRSLEKANEEEKESESQRKEVATELEEIESKGREIQKEQAHVREIRMRQTERIRKLKFSIEKHRKQKEDSIQRLKNLEEQMHQAKRQESGEDRTVGLKQELERETVHKEQLEKELNDCEHEVRDLSKESDVIQRGIANGNADLKEIDRDLRISLSGTKTSLDRYVRNLERLLGAIERNISRFRNPPIGPIGLLICPAHGTEQITDACLKGRTRSFIVSCKEDEILLRKLCREVDYEVPRPGMASRIEVFRRQKYDKPLYRTPDPPLGERSILTELSVNEDSISRFYGRIFDRFGDGSSSAIVSSIHNIIFNTLVDVARIERMLIRPMWRDNDEPPKPFELWCKDGIHVYWKKQTLVSEGLGILRDSIWWDKTSRSESDTKERIVALQSRKMKLQHELGSFTSQRSHLEGKLGSLRERIRDLKRKVQTKNNRIKDLEHTIAEEEPDVSWSLLMHEREREIETQKGCQKEIDERTSELKDIPTVEGEIYEIAGRLKLFEKERDAILVKVQAQEEVTRRIVAEKRATQTIVARLEEEEMRKIAQSKQKKSERMQRRRVQEEEIGAEEFWDFEVVFDSVRAIEEKLGNLEKRRKDLSTSTGFRDPNEVLRRDEELKERIDSATKEEKEMRNVLKTAVRGLKRRRRTFVEFKEIAMDGFKRDFEEFLARREFSGHLTFKHEEKKVEIAIRPATSSKESDIHALSGGESSYTQLCYLGAMWRSYEAPFHGVDEFDICMDAANRKMGVKVLMEIIKENLTDSQFIFVTPLDPSVIPSRVWVKTIDVSKLSKKS
eukprot:TRINITY_DN2659_c0_g1_i3.p1 TRINITY_DN2659_c0_g1~~TRINITY_DN2659_c0_g1_i3.p1  ORF type:complete len:1063 (+),score=322.07 TRINITY_DN2659_c0_g1_i3:115-3303(+)